MNSKPKLFAIAAVMALLLATVGPVAAFAGDETAGNDSMSTAGNDAPLAVHVTETDTDVTVTVTNASEPVSNANVTVAPVGDATYDGAGEYTTDENGTVSLPVPGEQVEVEIVATSGDERVTTTTVLGDWRPTVDGDAPFGQHVSRFVHYLLDRDDLDDDKPFGQMVREFVHEQKQRADKHAKKHDDESESADEESDREDKRPDHAKDKADKEDKRPDHAGPKDGHERGTDKTSDDGENEDSETDDEDEAENSDAEN
ncbi:hypothetical protein ACFQH3_14565 [Haladaptatus sp. GCM10025707]|uniref:hypothetical protein n=1 Tax=unclassified Haladaptatus TaxID=2622732 RepID=UPI0023E88E34|nr:hypothetical protein [Haladaptatus sp. QDMS2]